MRIIRVFIRKTSATPDDDMVRINAFPGFFDEADEVHISVAFTWDLGAAERLYCQWRYVAPCKIGGPATGEKSHDFIPGMYLKRGYVITSRGCPNNCWFCSVHKREGTIRELPITDGWNVLDDNLLACSESHIRSVFAMLAKHKKQRVEFTGGLEAKILKPWHVDLLADLKPKQMFFAYDTPDDLEPLIVAGKALRGAGLNQYSLRCYVLIGYPKDTIANAEKRLKETIKAGFMPAAMLYRDGAGNTSVDWRKFQRGWMRPAIIRKKMMEVCHD